MADGSGDQAVLARTITGLDEIDRTTWDALANPSDVPFNPFVSYDFLHALEASDSVGKSTGWTPLHVILEKEERPIAVAPFYAKGHSQGEYIFDHHWADAYMRAGGEYYPKLLCAAPFTPANGPRLLASDPATKKMLAAALKGVGDKFGVSSVHVNFVIDDDIQALEAAGYLTRTSSQYHWYNKNYQSFDDFLSVLSSRKRKAIRRERRQASQSDFVIRQISGTDMTPLHWDAFWTFYQDTGARKWGTPYLTRSFFDIVAETMGEEILFIVAERDGQPIAGALNFIGGDTLYGRYWGCTEHHAFLHFEICYYQAIDFAIANNLHCVEAGAQGEHKLARGYEPVTTISAHWIADPGFRTAIENYLQEERHHSEAEIKALKDFTPFKKRNPNE